MKNTMVEILCGALLIVHGVHAMNQEKKWDKRPVSLKPRAASEVEEATDMLTPFRSPPSSIRHTNLMRLECSLQSLEHNQTICQKQRELLGDAKTKDQMLGAGYRALRNNVLVHRAEENAQFLTLLCRYAGDHEYDPVLISCETMLGSLEKVLQIMTTNMKELVRSRSFPAKDCAKPDQAIKDMTALWSVLALTRNQNHRQEAELCKMLTDHGQRGRSPQSAPVGIPPYAPLRRSRTLGESSGSLRYNDSSFDLSDKFAVLGMRSPAPSVSSQSLSPAVLAENDLSEDAQLPVGEDLFTDV